MKIGKTTFGTKMPNHLILAAEKGYSAIPGAMAINVGTWGELKQIVKELKKPEVKEKYKSVIVDTVDLFTDYCQKYICSQLGIENIGDGGWTNNGWARYKKEFEDVFLSLRKLEYSIVFISHDKEKTITPQGGTSYQQIGSSMQSSALAIVENMSDIIGYAHPKTFPDGSTKPVLTLRSPDNSIRCGCRFKYIRPEIDFSYESLVQALNDAIDEEAKETNNMFITNEKSKPIETKSYDYQALKSEFNELVNQIMSKDSNAGPRIVSIVDKYLGKGKKVIDATPEQAELLYLIVTDMKEELL